MLSVKEAADMLEVSVPMVYKLINGKRIKANEEYRPGRVRPIITIAKDEVTAYIENVKTRRLRPETND